MKTRPLGILLLSCSLIGIGLLVPIQVLVLRDADQFFMMMTELNWIMTLSLITTGLMVYHFHSKSMEALAVTSLVVLLNNYWVGTMGTDYSFSQSMIGAIGFLGLNLFLLEPRTLQLLMKPELKWWTIPKRSRVFWTVAVRPQEGNLIQTFPVYDASENGLFVKLPSESLNQFRPGQSISILVKKDDGSVVSAEAKVVRMTTGHGGYPQGMGLTLSLKDTKINVPEETTRHLRAS